METDVFLTKILNDKYFNDEGLEVLITLMVNKYSTNQIIDLLKDFLIQQNKYNQSEITNRCFLIRENIYFLLKTNLIQINSHKNYNDFNNVINNTAINMINNDFITDYNKLKNIIRIYLLVANIKNQKNNNSILNIFNACFELNKNNKWSSEYLLAAEQLLMMICFEKLKNNLITKYPIEWKTMLKGIVLNIFSKNNTFLNSHNLPVNLDILLSDSNAFTKYTNLIETYNDNQINDLYFSEEEEKFIINFVKDFKQNVFRNYQEAKDYMFIDINWDFVKDNFEKTFNKKTSIILLKLAHFSYYYNKIDIDFYDSINEYLQAFNLITQNLHNNSCKNNICFTPYPGAVCALQLKQTSIKKTLRNKFLLNYDYLKLQEQTNNTNLSKMLESRELLIRYDDYTLQFMNFIHMTKQKNKQNKILNFLEEAFKYLRMGEVTIKNTISGQLGSYINLCNYKISDSDFHILYDLVKNYKDIIVATMNKEEADKYKSIVIDWEIIKNAFIKITSKYDITIETLRMAYITSFAINGNYSLNDNKMLMNRFGDINNNDIINRFIQENNKIFENIDYLNNDYNNKEKHLEKLSFLVNHFKKPNFEPILNFRDKSIITNIIISNFLKEYKDKIIKIDPENKNIGSGIIDNNADADKEFIKHLNSLLKRLTFENEKRYGKKIINSDI